MSGQVAYRGGWGEAPLSDQCKRQVAGLEARESQAEREARQTEEVWRAHNGIPSDAQRRATWEENNLRLAVQMAADEGVSPLEVHRGNWGHTKDEFVALVNDRMDHEDAVAAARQHRAFLEWQAENSGAEREPTRVERIAAGRAARAEAQLQERIPAVRAERAEKARKAEMKRIAGDVVEKMVLGLMHEGRR